MRYRALDENGDMTFGGNNKNFLKDIKAVIQAIKTRLKLLKGEWWENAEAGFPLFQDILGNYDKLKIKNRIVERIQQTQGVLSVADIEIEYENRKFNFNCTVSTIYGDTVFSFTEEK